MVNQGWPKEFDRLWDALVPESGQAASVQGEVVRIVGKLTDQAYRNGNGNWDRDHERMWRFVRKQLDDPSVFTEVERDAIRAAVDEIIRDRRDPDTSERSPYYRLAHWAVKWCSAKRTPIPHAADPSLKR